MKKHKNFSFLESILGPEGRVVVFGTAWDADAVMKNLMKVMMFLIHKMHVINLMQSACEESKSIGVMWHLVLQISITWLESSST